MAFEVGLVEDGGKAITYFGMGNPGTGPHWLAESRHSSDFWHWQTAAKATPVSAPGLRQRRSEGL